MPFQSSSFGLLPDGREVQLFELSNDHLTVRITNYGARIVSVIKDGVDLVHGPKTLEEFIADACYSGAVCGRVSNRIKDGKFRLNGRDYQLTINDPPNHLHGGNEGFDRKLWKLESFEEGELILSLESPAGEENYPGSVLVAAAYSLNKNALELSFQAESEGEPTLLGLTNHVYWNLNGNGTIDDHSLMLSASAYTPKDENGIPDGRILPVAGTPFDLTSPAILKERNSDKFPEIASGYDHNFALPLHTDIMEEIQLSASLKSETSGIQLDMYCDTPGIHVYTGEYLPNPRGGIALEAQNFPNAINYPHFPNPTLEPGDIYLLNILWVIQ